MDGYDQDDKWVMVEDEFLETAKLFTRHLHHAEYQRLKLLAKERKPSNIMQRVDSMAVASNVVEKNAEDEELGADRPKTTRRAVGKQESETWEDGAWASNPRLARLMVRNESTKLTRPVALQPSIQDRGKRDSSQLKNERKPASPPLDSIPSSPPMQSRQTRPIHPRPTVSSPSRVFSGTAHSQYKFSEPHSGTDARRRKGQEEKQKPVKLEEIPTFLI